MIRRKARTARTKDGQTITVGSRVLYIGYGQLMGDTPVCEVIGIHRQGADGTIVTLDKAPDSLYPSHNSGRATCFKLVADKGENGASAKSRA
jgi:hypothetical protein